MTAANRLVALEIFKGKAIAAVKAVHTLRQP